MTAQKKARGRKGVSQERWEQFKGRWKINAVWLKLDDLGNVVCSKSDGLEDSAPDKLIHKIINAITHEDFNIGHLKEAVKESGRLALLTKKSWKDKDLGDALEGSVKSPGTSFGEEDIRRTALLAPGLYESESVDEWFGRILPEAEQWFAPRLTKIPVARKHSRVKTSKHSHNISLDDLTEIYSRFVDANPEMADIAAEKCGEISRQVKLRIWEEKAALAENQLPPGASNSTPILSAQETVGILRELTNKDEIQRFLDRFVVGKTWGNLEDNQRVAYGVTDSLRSLRLRVRCLKDGEPSYLRAVATPSVPEGAWYYEHFTDKKQQRHGAPPLVPQLEVVPEGIPSASGPV